MGLPRVSREVVEVMMREPPFIRGTEASKAKGADFSEYLAKHNPVIAYLLASVRQGILEMSGDKKTADRITSIAFDTAYLVYEALRRQDEVDALEQANGRTH